MLLSDLSTLFSTFTVAFRQSYVASKLALISTHLSNVQGGVPQTFAHAANTVWSHVSSMQASLLSSKDVFKRDIEVGTMFDDIRLITGHISSISQHLPPNVDTTPITTLVKALLEFRDAYQSFITHQDAQHTYALMLKAEEVSIRMDTAGAIASMLISALERPMRELSYDYDILVLRTNTYATALDLLKRLDALIKLYSIIGAALDAPLAERPLEISRIESGSTGFKLFGDGSTIKVIGAMIEKSASWLYRQIAHGGAVNGMKLHRELLNESVEIRKLLAEQNINTSKLDERLQEAGERLGNELLRFLDGSTETQVNKTHIRFSDTFEAAYRQHVPFVDSEEPPLLLTDEREQLQLPKPPEGEE